MGVFIFFTFILSYILFSISREDIRTMKINETKLRVFAASGVSYLIYLGSSNKNINTIDLILKNFYHMLIIFLIMYFIKSISYKIFRENLLGMGDIKLTSISTIWLGIEMSYISLCISFSLSAIYGLNGKISKRFKRFHQYPFVPFLSIGIFFSWILDKI